MTQYNFNHSPRPTLINGYNLEQTAIVLALNYKGHPGDMMRYILHQIYGITPNRSKEYKLHSAWYRNALAYLSRVVEEYSHLDLRAEQSSKTQHSSVSVSQIASHSKKSAKVVNKAIADIRRTQQLNSAGTVGGEEMFDWNSANLILSRLGYYDNVGNSIYHLGV